MKSQKMLVLLASMLLLVLGGIAVQAAQPYEPNETTLGLWHMDEFLPPWDDSSGNELHLQVRGSMMSLPGLFGNALGGVTPGSFAYVNHKGVLALQTFTLEAWITYVPADSQQTIAQRRWPGNTWALNVDAEGSPSFTWWNEAGTSERLIAPVTLNPNTWYHIAVVVETADEATSVKLYVTPHGETEAVLVAEKTSNVVMFDNQEAYFYVANDGTQQDKRYFRGLIDEVRYSAGALSPDMFTTLK